MEAVEKTHLISSTNKYRIEWDNLLSSLSSNFEILRNLAFNGELKTSKFRSICWSILLRVLNENPNCWKEQRKQQRERYEKLKSEFVKNPHKLCDLNDDPLSQSKQSVWNQYFFDQELYSVIKQDVVRTFPGVEFFQKSTVQEAMINILFYYAREHPYMSYRQGMHEILAPILFVMHSDFQALLHFKEISNEIDDKLLNVLSPDHLEADSYSLFSRLMSSIESYYRIVNMVPSPDGYFPQQTDSIVLDDNVAANEVEVIGQLNFIRDKILAKEDLDLHNHLLKLDIPLHIFGIRWLRLLFGREFPMQDLLTLWDAIFADSDRFELPNYILVAMLIRIRDKLLLSDYTTCLTLLMKYPINVDVGLILRYALHMQMPKRFVRPNEAFIYVKIKSEQEKKLKKRNKEILTRQLSLKSADHSSKNNQRNRSSSLTINNNSFNSESVIKNIQKTNSINIDDFTNQTQIQTTDLKIIDGYRENSLEAVRAELRIAQNIMSLTRQKLQKYLFIIKQNFSNSNQTDELNQALTGIEELCSFLDVKFIELNIESQAVDPASEAAEAAQIKLQSKKINQLPSSSTKTNEQNNVDVLKEKDIDVNIFLPHYNNSEICAKTRYEIPDNSYMRNSNKFLGTKKDVELKLFKSELSSKELLDGVPIPDPLGIRET